MHANGGGVIMFFKRSLRVGWLEILLGVCGIVLLIQLIRPALIPGLLGGFGDRLLLLVEFSRLPWWGWTIFFASMSGVLFVLRVLRAVAENRGDPHEKAILRRQDEGMDALQRAALAKMQRTSQVDDEASTLDSSTTAKSTTQSKGDLQDDESQLAADIEHSGGDIASGDYDYATQVLKDAVLGDPTNVVYLQNLLRKLRTKTKRKARRDGPEGLKAHAARSAMKNALEADDWKVMIDAVCELLKRAPDDVTSLLALATAYEKRGAGECELYCLTTVFQTDSNDLDILRPLGRALARAGKNKKALGCWRRIKAISPGDEEAGRMIDKLNALVRLEPTGSETAESDSSALARTAAGEVSDSQQGAAQSRVGVDFQAASRFVRSQYDVATEVLIQCVIREPKNSVYLQNLLRSLRTKHDRKRRNPPATDQSEAARSALQIALDDNNWKGIVEAVCDIVSHNPKETAALVALAEGYEKQDADECQLYCFRTALEADTKNLEVLRPFGRALTRMGQIEQALGCWRRVEKASPGDEEACRMIDKLSTRQGGVPPVGVGQPTTPAPQRQALETKLTGTAAVREEALQRSIQSDPMKPSNYGDLADLYLQNESLEEAASILQDGLNAIGEHLEFREQLENVQMSIGKRKVELAMHRAEASGARKAHELAERIKQVQNRRELEIYTARVERTPGQVVHRFEWGMRLKRAGQFTEAIQAFQAARSDARHKGEVDLELGECFRAVGQDRLALKNYEAAISATPEEDLKTKTKALYQAGVLAYEMSEVELAEKHLTALAELDFNYRDVASWLEKIAQVRTES